jgi:hypothetical protein
MEKENSPKETSRPQNGIVGSRSWLNRLRTGQSGKRLAAELDVYSIEISLLNRKLREAKLDPSAYGYDTLSGLLKKSACALKKNDVAKGWKAFSAAHRIETYIYYRLTELTEREESKEFATGWLQAKAVSVYTEGNQKLRRWRKKTIKSLLSEKNQLKPITEIGSSDLTQSERILSEHHSNVYHRLGIIRSQFSCLLITAVIAIVGWVILLILKGPPIKIDVYDLTLNIQTIIFGVLGACVSGILTLANSSTRQHIPEKLLNSWVTFARPLVGLVSALAVVNFTLIGILDFGEESLGLYLAAAFIAGFSERLLIKTIESIVGKANRTEEGNEKTPDIDS